MLGDKNVSGLLSTKLTLLILSVGVSPLSSFHFSLLYFSIEKEGMLSLSLFLPGLASFLKIRCSLIYVWVRVQTHTFYTHTYEHADNLVNSFVVRGGNISVLENVTTPLSIFSHQQSFVLPAPKTAQLKGNMKGRKEYSLTNTCAVT